jgi:hypothetical protein
MPAVQWLDEHEKEKGINPHILEALDLFIFQHVSTKNKFGYLLSTENIISKLSDECEQISFPNVYFGGYYPQYVVSERNVLVNSKWHRNGVVPYGDFILEDFFTKQKSDLNLENCLLDENLFSKDYVLWALEKSFLELETREAKCTIKISDYIRDTYKKRFIFYSPSHSTNEVIYELTKRILIKLAIETNTIEETLPENDGVEMLLYPSVQKHLELEFTKNEFTFCKTLKEKKDTISNYARSYGYFCFIEHAKSGQPVSEQLNLYKLVMLNKKLVTDRTTGSFVVNNLRGGAHLSMYLNLHMNSKNETIAYLPKCYAPSSAFYATGSAFIKADNRNCVIKIDTSGAVICNSNFGSCVLSINTSWVF